MEVTPFILSTALALITTTLLFIGGLPLAYILAYKKFTGKQLLDICISLPLLIPPTVLGFYLLLLFSPTGFLGHLAQYFGLRLAFSFPGIVIGACIASVPFMIQPLKAALLSVPKSHLEASYTLGKSPLETFFRIALPASLPGILSALALTFAHTMGEFGVILMLGGSIPGSTKVASIALYEYVEAQQYSTAHMYAAIMVILSCLILFCINRWKKTESAYLL
jgi:molybdate transport system permease protein